MTADVSLPDRPRGVEWLELGTLLSLSLTAVLVAWIWGFVSGAGANTSAIATDVTGPPSVAINALKVTLTLSVVMPASEIVAKRIADSAGDGASAQAEPDTQTQSADSG
jgi:hypothetical protein